MSEYEDKSQYLGKGAAAITVARQNKGDLKQFESSELHAKGIKSFSWLPDELNRLGIISDEHLYIAEFVKRIRDCHSRFLDPSIKLALQRILTDEGKKEIPSEDMFRALIRGLYRDRKQIVAPLRGDRWLWVRDLMVDRQLEPFRFDNLLFHARNRKALLKECYDSVQERLEKIYEAW